MCARVRARLSILPNELTAAESADAQKMQCPLFALALACAAQAALAAIPPPPVLAPLAPVSARVAPPASLVGK